MTRERPDDCPAPMTYDEIEEKWGKEARQECEAYWDMRAEAQQDPTTGLIYSNQTTEVESEHVNESEQTDICDWTGDSDA